MNSDARATALGNSVDFLSLLVSLLLSFILFLLDFFLSGALGVSSILWFFLLPHLLALLGGQRRSQVIVDVCKTHNTGVMVLVSQSLDPFLIVQAKRQLNWLGSLNLRGLLLLFRKLLVAVEPLEGRHDHFKSFLGAVPLGLDLSIATLIGSAEFDLLDWRVVQTSTTDVDASASNLGTEIWLDSLNAHVIVTEINGFTSELLSVECHVDGVGHVVGIIAFDLWHSANNASIFIESFSTGPCLNILFSLRGLFQIPARVSLVTERCLSFAGIGVELLAFGLETNFQVLEVRSGHGVDLNREGNLSHQQLIHTWG